MSYWSIMASSVHLPFLTAYMYQPSIVNIIILITYTVCHQLLYAGITHSTGCKVHVRTGAHHLRMNAATTQIPSKVSITANDTPMVIPISIVFDEGEPFSGGLVLLTGMMCPVSSETNAN